MKTWFDRALLGLHVAGAFFALVLAVVILYDVAGRMFFNKPFAGTVELTAIGLVLLTFLQAPYVIREKKLLRVTFFLDRVPPLVRSYMNAFAYIIGAAFFVSIFIASWEPAMHGLASGEFFGSDAFRIPAWPLRFGSIILWAIGAVVCISFAINGLAGRMSATEESSE